MQPGDGELMQRIKEGDMRAFDVLVRRWECRLFNLIYKIVGDFETAEDVRQEVFLRVYQSSKRYRPQGQFKTWLYRIAINCSINELRKRQRRQTLPLATAYGHNDIEEHSAENVLPDPSPGPDDIVQRKEMAGHIQDALRRLPDKQRLVVILRHYDGLKFQEIASLLDCPLGTVKSRMRHGLEQLRIILGRLSREGGTQYGL